MNRRTESSKRVAWYVAVRAGAIVALTFVLFAAPLALASLVACGSGSDSTGGHRVELASRVQSESLSFANSYAWTVDVERALVSVGGLRYLEGAVVARHDRPAFSPTIGGFAAASRWFRVREAKAHPGHYEAGGTIGEMLTPTSVDLALGPADLGPGPGITGTARSAQFTFQSPAEGTFASDLGTSVVIVEGRASQGAESRSFSARASVEDVMEGGYPAVVGCELRNGGVDTDGVVTLTVRMSVWLDQIDFALVPVDPGGARVELAREQTPHKAFVRGLKKASAYVFSYAHASR